ncbi:hypothetical protein ACFYTB_20595 [Bacillus velezensis]
MKKLLSGLLVVAFSLGLYSPSASAEENVAYEDDNFVVTTSDSPVNSGVGHFIIPEKNKSDFSTQGTAIGNGGKATLNSSNDRRRIYWSVKPKTWGPYLFQGKLKLRYYSGYKRDALISAWGALGSTASGVEYLNKNNGGKVYMSGKAVTTSGSIYGVLPSFSIAF